MATNPPSYPCPWCGGALDWEIEPSHREPWEPVRFGPTDWRQLPHECDQEVVKQRLAEAFERGAKEKSKPFFTKVTSAYQPNKQETSMSATLRLKMTIGSVKSTCDQNGDKSSEEITLQAVYGPEGTPNAQWSKWTPSANLTMHVNNPNAFGKVLPGQFYFVDLIPTTKEAI